MYQNFVGLFEAAKAEEKVFDKAIYTIGEVPKAPGLNQAKAAGNKDPSDQKAMDKMAALVLKQEQVIADLKAKVKETSKKKPTGITSAPKAP